MPDRGSRGDTQGDTSLFKFEQQRLTGLDIGSSSVKLVELSGTAPDLQLERIALASIVEDDLGSTCGRAISMILDSNTLDCSVIPLALPPIATNTTAASATASTRLRSRASRLWRTENHNGTYCGCRTSARRLFALFSSRPGYC